MRAPQESVHAGLCHLFNVIPLWGLLYCGWAMYSMREESRYVVRNAREAMIFHSLLMLVTLVFLIGGLFCRLIGVLVPGVGGVLQTVNLSIFAAAAAVYWTICLVGAWRCFSGMDFHYPLVGQRSS